MKRTLLLWPLFALSIAAALLTGCLTTQLPPVSEVGPGFTPLADEAELWAEARYEEERLLDEVVLYDDAELAAYLQEIVDELTPPGMEDNRSVVYRVRVLEDPTLNAFAYPHGSLYLHTGLLATMENEAQLATVLGHEMTHVENRHMLRFRRSAQNKEIGLGVAALAAELILAERAWDALDDGDWHEAVRIGILSDLLIGLGLQLAYVAAVNGYGRDLEIEADDGAFAKLTVSGYDPTAAPEVYRALRDGPGGSEGGGFFFASHPKLTTRIENAERWLEENPEPAARGGERRLGRFEENIRWVVRDDARMNLELGRLDIAEARVRRALALLPLDPESHLILARVRLAQIEAEAGDQAALAAWQAEADAALREVIRLDPDRPEPYLELGLAALDRGDRAAACRELRLYLELERDEARTGLAAERLEELEAAGECR